MRKAALFLLLVTLMACSESQVFPPCVPRPEVGVSCGDGPLPPIEFASFRVVKITTRDMTVELSSTDTGQRTVG